MTAALDRALACFDGDDPALRARAVRAFEAIFLLVLGAEYWFRALPKLPGLPAFYLGSAVVASACCLAGLHRPWRRGAFAALLLVHGMVGWVEFPATSNHTYLELIICGLCAGLDLERDPERRLLVRAAGWLVCLVLFWSGVQKLAHGYWTGGQFLAWQLRLDTFRTVLAPLLAADELARLAAYDGRVGEGPYLLASRPALLVSNAVWLAELVLPALLCWRRTRALAVIGVLGLLVGIQAAAREVSFGLVLADATLLVLGGDWLRRLVLPVAVGLAGLVLSQAGALPAMVFR